MKYTEMSKIELNVYIRAHGGSNKSTEKIDINNLPNLRVYFYWQRGDVVGITALDQELLKILYRGIKGNSGPLINSERKVTNEAIEILNKINRFDSDFRGNTKGNSDLLKNRIIEQTVPNYCITWDDEKFRTAIILQGSDGTKEIFNPKLTKERFPECLEEFIECLQDPENFLGSIASQYHQVNLHWTSCRG
jgi:hypothetical protein